jgi:hypothetical protein
MQSLCRRFLSIEKKPLYECDLDDQSPTVVEDIAYVTDHGSLVTKGAIGLSRCRFVENR